MMYGKRLVQTRQYREAEPVLERLLTLREDDGKGWMQLVKVFKQTRNYKKAESTLRRAIAACPENAKLRQALADFCRQQKRFDEAREHFRRAMLIDPQMQSIYDSWGAPQLLPGPRAAAAAPTHAAGDRAAIAPRAPPCTAIARIACSPRLPPHHQPLVAHEHPPAPSPSPPTLPFPAQDSLPASPRLSRSPRCSLASRALRLSLLPPRPPASPTAHPHLQVAWSRRSVVTPTPPHSSPAASRSARPRDSTTHWPWRRTRAA